MNANAKTHKNENTVRVLLPALDHLVIFFLSGFGVYGEERPRAVTKAGFSLRWLTRCELSPVAIYFIYVCELGVGMVKQTDNTHLNRSPPRGLWERLQSLKKRVTGGVQVARRKPRENCSAARKRGAMLNSPHCALTVKVSAHILATLFKVGFHA
jgi:hypothetical protein